PRYFLMIASSALFLYCAPFQTPPLATAAVRRTFGTARWAQAVMMTGAFSHGVFPYPVGGPVWVPAKYAVDVRISSDMLIPICFTPLWKICASCGISPVFSVVSLIAKPFG